MVIGFDLLATILFASLLQLFLMLGRIYAAGWTSIRDIHLMFVGLIRVKYPDLARRAGQSVFQEV